MPGTTAIENEKHQNAERQDACRATAANRAVITVAHAQDRIKWGHS